MLWNQWRCSTRGRDELLAAARGVVAGGAVVAQVEDGAITWSVPTAALEDLAARLDPDEDELDDDWEEDIDDIDDDAYAIVLVVEADPELGMRLTWEPKAGDNDAAWPIAWLVVTRFVRAIGAEQVTVSASALLRAPDAPARALPLPVVVASEACVLPSGRPFPITVEDEPSIAAIARALSQHDGWCVVAVPLEDDELEPVACVARITKHVAVSSSSHVVVLSGAARMELARIDDDRADGRIVEAAEPDAEIPSLLLEAADQLLTLTIAQDNIPDDALEVLQQLPASRLADGAAEIFSGLLDRETRIAVLQELDASERAMLLVETLRGTIDAIQDELDEHDGDLESARLALLENELDEHDHEH